MTSKRTKQFRNNLYERLEKDGKIRPMTEAEWMRAVAKYDPNCGPHHEEYLKKKYGTEGDASSDESK